MDDPCKEIDLIRRWLDSNLLYPDCFPDMPRMYHGVEGMRLMLRRLMLEIDNG